MLLSFKKENYNYGVLGFVLSLILFFSLSINIAFGLIVLISSFFILIKHSKLFFCFFIQTVFFQNTYIAFFSGFIDTPSHFKILHGINFLLPAFLTLFMFKNSAEYFSKLFFKKSILIILILLGYFVFGAIHYDLITSALYLRLFLIPILYLLVGIYFSKKLPINFINDNLKSIFVICAIFTTLQFFFPFTVSYFLNDLDYFSIKRGVSDWEELLESYRSKRLFNISWFDIRLFRIGSLIKSIISLGYFLIIFGIYFYWPNKKFRLFLIFIIVVLAINSKGAILVLFFSLMLYFLFYKSNLSTGLALSFYLMINFALIYLGHISRNEHIVGFLSGSNYLLSLGNGLGFSGNLSDSLFSSWRGDPLPNLEYWTRFQNGSESVYGVLFSSLGIFSIVYILYFIEILKQILSKLKSNTPNIRVLRVLAIVLFLQGIYQEEAYSPYCFGLVMFLVGLNFNQKNEEEIIPV